MPPFSRSVDLGRPALIAAAVLLGGCASAVVVQSEFPAPLVEPLPVRVGVIFDDELHNYIYYEELPNAQAWTIDMGDANIAMFEPLFENMFVETDLVEDLAAAAGGPFDGVLWPALEKFEFDLPYTSRDQFVEVWLQYRLSLYRPNGDVIYEWPVSGYGKAEIDGKREEAVHRAAVVALRDVGATISTKFAEQNEISYWLSEGRDEANNRPTEPAGPGTPAVAAADATPPAN